MIIAGRILVDPSRRPEPGWIRVQNDRIVEIGSGAPSVDPDLGNCHTIVTPGFLDAHMHLPQVDSIGCDGSPLLQWLDETIFPAEQRWADPLTAQTQARTAYQRLLHAGTLGFAGYATSHADAMAGPATAGLEIPLRAVVGQVLMDRNGPEELTQNSPTPPADVPAARLIASVNPRFAVSCSPGLLDHAARLAETGRIVQTHLAETIAECELVASLFPDVPHYTAVYDQHGLLHDRTLLAHAIHLSDAEWALIAKRRSVVVHCPSANTFLTAGLFDLRAARAHGVRLALGSDIAAGPDFAMPRVARAMIDVAKLRRLTLDADAVVPTPAEAWLMITHGNAQALGWMDAGQIAVGAAADLLLLETPFDPDDDHLIGRLIYGWRDSFIAERIVAGRAMGSTSLGVDDS